MPKGGARPGTGRKPIPDKEKRVSLTVRIPPHLKKIVSNLSCTASSFVERAIIRELQRSEILQSADDTPPTDKKT